MPVTVIPSLHGANAIQGGFAQTPLQVLKQACPYTKKQSFEIIQSSFGKASPIPALQPVPNGLVNSIVLAYSQHHHLQLRPEDIWFAALTQFSLFVNAHGEELRSKFVSHQGQKELRVVYDKASRWVVDFADFAQKIGLLIEQNVVDPELRTWMMPNFSTSKRQDEVIASIIMMGSMQKYFSYVCEIECGIPSVTLLGEKEDWEKLLQKIDKFDEYGDEPKQFAQLLRPVVRRFIRSFEEPQSQAIVDFWRRVLSVKAGSGFVHYTGWVTAFAFWNEDGKRISHAVGGVERPEKGDTGEANAQILGGSLHLTLDGVSYHRVNKKDVPPGWAKAPVKIVDYDTEIEAEMVAGSIGISCSSSESTEKLDENGKMLLDTVQPETAWWILEKTGQASKHDGKSEL